MDFMLWVPFLGSSCCRSSCYGPNSPGLSILTDRHLSVLITLTVAGGIPSEQPFSDDRRSSGVWGKIHLKWHRKCTVCGEADRSHRLGGSFELQISNIEKGALCFFARTPRWGDIKNGEELSISLTRDREFRLSISWFVFQIAFVTLGLLIKFAPSYRVLCIDSIEGLSP